MIQVLIRITLTSLVFLKEVQAARILMTSPQIKSHTLEQLSIGKELVARGHQVYVAIGSRYPNPESFEKSGIKTLKYKIPDDVPYLISAEVERKIVQDVVFNSTENVVATTAKISSDGVWRDCAFMMDDDDFLETVKRLEFELAIVEPFILVPCTLILPKHLGIPFVSLATVYIPWNIRVPALPSVSPILSTWLSYSQVGFFSRLENLLTYLTIENMLRQLAGDDTSLIRRFSPDANTWNDILRQSELFLTEFDHHLNGIMPSMPYFISVAGLTATKAEKLPADLESIVESSIDGVILLSFGSTADHFPSEVIAKFFQAFAKLNQTVLAKFTIASDVQVPANVKALSWLPQNDILGHRKTKLFITHCGNNGQYEALYHAVPMIGFPLFAEQKENCLRGYQRGFSLTMDIHDFTADELVRNIVEVVYNPKYKTAIEKASDIFRDQPMHPREKAAFWIEHVIRHGGGHLRSFLLDMPLHEFLMLDILGVAIFVLLAFIITFSCLVFHCTRYFCRTSSQAPSKLKSQ